ncbi:hypothetical protein EMGBS4_02790 [Acidimicrobiaceae bacterium]|nr:hypothetical protein EMGBS4_02790 [Acidimicrobiaceae bacterium]
MPPRGSIAAHIQAEIPLSQVVAAFQHLPATELGNLAHEVDSDVLICSDDRKRRQQSPRLSHAFLVVDP